MVSAPGRSQGEPRKRTGPTRSPQTFPPLWLLSIWFGLFTGAAELGFVYAQSSRGVVNSKCPTAEPAFSLDDPARQLCSVSGLGPCCPFTWSIMETARRPTECLSVERSRMPGSALRISRALWDRIYRFSDRLRSVGRLVHLAHPGAILPACIHEPSCLDHLGLLVRRMEGGPDCVGERWAISASPEHDRRGMNVLLLVMDTVRADRFSLYGYGRPTTPNLKRIAERGVRFDQARATRPGRFRRMQACLLECGRTRRAFPKIALWTRLVRPWRNSWLAEDI